MPMRRGAQKRKKIFTTKGAKITKQKKAITWPLAKAAKDAKDDKRHTHIISIFAFFASLRENIHQGFVSIRVSGLDSVTLLRASRHKHWIPSWR